MALFHNVNIYWGSEFVTSSTRLEVAAMSPILNHIMASFKLCEGCREPTTFIFPSQDESKNTLEEVFKSASYKIGQIRYSVVASNVCV